MRRLNFNWKLALAILIILVIIIIIFFEKAKLPNETSNLNVIDSKIKFDSINLIGDAENRKLDSIRLVDSLAPAKIIKQRFKDSIQSAGNISDRHTLHIKIADTTITPESLPLISEIEKPLPDAVEVIDNIIESGELTSCLDTDLKIKEIATCERITKDIHCSEPKSNFCLGETVFITFYVVCCASFINDNYVIHWKQDLELIKPDGNSITKVKLLNFRYSVDSSGKYRIPVYNALREQDLDIQGKYNAIIRVYNQSLETSVTIEFIVN
jgi:hypothetical protein